MKKFLDYTNLNNFISLDLETTGLNPLEDKIIEISAIKFSNGKPIDTFTKLINPKQKISSTSIKITGITDDMVKNEPEFKDVENDFIDFIDKYPIVGQNILFDLSFLEKNMKNYNSIFYDRMICDTYYLSKIFFYSNNYFSLTSLCKKLKISVDNAHRAESDAKNAGYLFLEIVKIILKKYATPLLFQKLSNCIKSYDVPNYQFFKKAIKFFLENSLNIKYEKKENIYNNYSFVYNTKNKNEIDITSIDDLFNKEGLISKNLINYEFRQSQLDFASDIDKTLLNNGCLIAEAGAGLGKSYAYLFGSLINKNKHDSQIIVSTNTHSLQTQLFEKDIPFVLDVLDKDCKVTLIKGMNNYICISRLEEVLADSVNILNKYEAMELMSLILWLDQTITGDIIECNGFNKNRYSHLWAQINSRSDTCLTYKCNKHDGCFYRDIRNDAKDSDVLIVNHSMLISYQDSQDNFINNDAICIFDESHNFHMTCQRQLSNEINSNVFQDLKTHYSKIGNQIIKHTENLRLKNDKIISCFNNIINLFIELAKEFYLTNINQRFESEYFQNFIFNKDESYLSTYSQSDEIINIMKKLENLLDDIKNILNNEDRISNKRFIVQDIDFLLKNIKEKHEVFSLMIKNNSSLIYWLSYKLKNDSVKNTSFNLAPSNLNGISCKIFEKFHSTIFCSATLCTDNGFDFFINQMGMKDIMYDEQVILKKYLSPYYYNDQTKLFVIQSESNINSPDYIKKISSDIIEMHKTIPKRILILCTSFKQILEFEKNINQLYPNNENILFQTKGKSKDILLSEYLNNKNSILFGTNTFWEGIDLPKDKLEILVIFKLPFSNPSDPFVQANIDYYLSKNLNPFMSYQVEDTILKLKQGFGRLIRSTDDMGVCIITDPRIAKKKYGQNILNSLPVEAHLYSSNHVLVNEIKKFLK